LCLVDANSQHHLRPRHPRDRSPDRSYTPSSEHKNNKGLRHFSMKVCQKVKEKGTTTYNEVAEELVQECQVCVCVCVCVCILLCHRSLRAL
jgi:hypothetical protein